MLSVLFHLLISVSMAATPVVEIAPPIPQTILWRVQQKGHPFLLADQIQLQNTLILITNPLFEDRRTEFVKRVQGFEQDKSPWHIQGGPFATDPKFHPSLLADEDFDFYTRVLCETAAFEGLEHERWAMNGLIKEVLRMLNELEPKSSTGASGLSQTRFTRKQANLLALTAMLYDMVYYRFDNLLRRESNTRIKEIRDRFSTYCAALKTENLEPDERIALGAGLGLSTLLCISINSSEGKTRESMPVQTLLPDLYRAAMLTRSGMSDAVSSEKQLAVSLDRLESALLVALPWIQCMKRLGYVPVVKNGAFSAIVSALEAHRVPGTGRLIMPSVDWPFTTPWVPQSYALFTPIKPELSSQEAASTEPNTATQTVTVQPDSLLPPPELGKFTEPITRQELNDRRPGRAMTLKEQLQLYGLPRRSPPPAPFVKSATYAVEAGWTRPTSVHLPTVWGAFYVLAALEDPSSNAGDVWSEQAQEVDSHPYTFLFYRNLPPSPGQEIRKRTLIRYPGARATLLSVNTLRENYILGTQAARGTLVRATVAIDHESFFMTEENSEWRWFHEIPTFAASRAKTGIRLATPNLLSATSPMIKSPTSIASAKTISTSTPITTSLYSLWETYSPVGKTLVIRRHEGGVGSAYTLVAHFPDTSPQRRGIEYIDFHMPEESEVSQEQEIPGGYTLIPKTAQDYREPAGMDEWQRMRRAERMGHQKPANIGILKILFSPEAVRQVKVFNEVFGRFMESQLASPQSPFFYITFLDQAGREKYDVKYASLPLPGFRVLEWRQGIEVLAMNMGKGIQNDLVESDADFVLVTRDLPMKGIFYLMVHGTYLRARFSSTQRDWTSLVDTRKMPMTVVWSDKRIYTDRPPRTDSVFYAPEVIGFECPGTVVKYGRKARQAMVLKTEPSSRR